MEPGARYSTLWSGRLFAGIELPACAGCSELGTCEATFAAPAGAYRLLVEVFTAAADCGAACECDAGDVGSCGVTEPAVEPRPPAGAIDFVHPDEPALVVVVE